MARVTKSSKNMQPFARNNLYRGANIACNLPNSRSGIAILHGIVDLAI